jgi:hypothetical protein
MKRADEAPLREAQQRLRQLITAASGDERSREAARLLRGDPQRPAALRLEIYAHAWRARLRSVLADDYPALARVLGEPAFDALVSAYLSAHPPSRPSLRDAGAQLPEFLAQSPDAVEARERAPFAADLAQLEWALVEAFDAADAAPLARAALNELEPERWAELRLRFQPALRRLALGFPVDRVRRAHDEGRAELPAALAPESTQVCVWRSQERVYLRALAPLAAEALALAQAGAGFGRLCEALAERSSDAEAPAHAAGLLARWQADGWLAAFE